MIATVVILAVVLLALSLFAVLIAAVVGPAAFENGFEEGRRAERLRPTPGNVRRLPVQR